ncbi:MAG: ATP-binding protein [Brevinematia bacterium]
MKEDSLSQIIKHTIEKIGKIPQTTLVKLLEELWEERERFLTILNFSLRRAVFVVSSLKEIIFFNDFCIKLGILEGTEGNWIFEENFGEHISRTLENMIKEKISFYSVSVKLNSKWDLGESVLKERTLKIECSTKNFEVFYFVVSDITEETIANLDKIQEESLTSLSNVASSIAHEIKNPLSAMYLHAKVLRKILEKKTFNREYALREIDVILSEIDRLNNVVNEMMFSLRPYKFAEKYENINSIVNEVVEFFLPEFRERGIIIEVMLDEFLPMVLCDKNLIKQALVNLIKNSIEAVKDGEGVIEIRTYFISKFDGDFVVIEIKDNGYGIPEEVKQRIFEPFFTTKESGLGIGLSIVYKIIKLHKGNIDFSSRRGETVFRVSLPVAMRTKELRYDRR